MRSPPDRWRTAYLIQRKDAARRGIPFHLSFRTWFIIWNESGRLEQRGRLKGQYVMGRYGDVGAYEIGNVKIISVEENHSEGAKGKSYGRSEATKLKLRLARLGSKLSEEHKRKISLSLKGRKLAPWGEERKRNFRKRIAGRLGRKHSKEAIEKIRKARKDYWKRLREGGA